MSTILASSTMREPQSTSGVNPKKFLLWLLIVSIVMMFGAFTSAYIVRRAEGNWLEFDLPAGFLVSTVLIVLSSVTMQAAYFAARKDNLLLLRGMLAVTLLLGLGFLLSQWSSWGELVQNNIFFGGRTSNPAGSFVYVLSGVHAFHLVTGLLFLIIVLISALRYSIHSRNMLRMEMCTTYWHFLGGLWVYLYAFLQINH